MHYHLGRFDESQLEVPSLFARHSRGYARATLVGRPHGSVHMQVCIGQLDAGGQVSICVHAFEKGIYVLEGEVELRRGTEAFRLGEHDYALIAYGSLHAFRNTTGKRARWFEMSAPQPKPAGGWQDTFFPDESAWPEPVAQIAADASGAQSAGRFRARDPIAPSGPGIRGLSVYRFMEQKFGARHFYMMRGELAPGGFRSRHDHPIEEFYFGLKGEASMDIEDETFELGPGVVAWTGVGTSHAFRNAGSAPFEWIETQAPQFPAHNGTRNYDQWQQPMLR